MKFKSIQLLNWGPYQDLEPINLETSDKSPITIIYGNNGRGKTSLFNAIFYVLYGEQPDKFLAGRYANWFKVMEGKEFPVKITLIYESQGREIKITRGFNAIPKDKITKEVLVTDQYQTMVIDNGQPVNEKSIDSFIRMDLPQEVAKFFLFDGEELEKVLKGLSDSQSTARLPIKDGIESLLGIPSLRYLSQEIEKMADSLEKEIESVDKTYMADQDHKEKSEKLESDIKSIESDISAMTVAKSKLIADNNNLMHELQKFEAAREDIGHIKALQGDEAKILSAIDTFQNQLTGYLSESWFLPLSSIAEKKNSIYLQNLKQLKTSNQEVFRYESRIGELTDQIKNRKCSSCGHDLEVNESVLKQEISQIEDKLQSLNIGNVPDMSAGEVWVKIHSNCQLNKNIVIESDKNVRRSKYDLSRIRTEISKIENRLKLVNHIELQDKISVREANNKTINDLENNINVQNENLLTKKKAKQKARAQIVGAKGVSPVFKVKLNYLEQLSDVIESAIVDYASAIRLRVEKRASEHYVSLMKNDDITGLEISADYQVWITHKTLGRKPAGSFGQNLVFVYALIGALIDVSGNGSSWVIDTPISRLDEVRAPSVWEWIAKRNRQVIVLPHKNELTPETAKNLLAGKIGREYEIVAIGDDAWSEVKPLLT